MMYDPHFSLSASSTAVWALAISLSLVACSAARAQGPTLDTPFELRASQEVTVDDDGVSLRFEGVEGDSRCPVDVQCMWAGDAAVQLTASRSGESRSVTLHTHGGDRYPKQAEVFGFELSLEALDPQPHSEKPVGAEDYRAHLVLRAGPGAAQ